MYFSSQEEFLLAVLALEAFSRHIYLPDFFSERRMTPGLCMAILLIILEDITKYNKNMPESAILAASAATPILMMKGCKLGHIPIPLT